MMKHQRSKFYFPFKDFSNKRKLNQDTYTHTHTFTYMLIYMYTSKLHS